MTVEPLSAADLPEWLELRLALWPEAKREEHLAEMQEFLATPERYGQFIARSPERRPLGFAEAAVRNDYVNGTQGSPVAFLEGIYVTPEARRQGVARALVRAVADWGKRKGCAELASDALLDNTVSQAVHARLGFVETERVVYFNMKL